MPRGTTAQTRALQRDLFSRRWRHPAATPDKEVNMQIELADKLRWCLRENVCWFHVPNGEIRNKRTAAKLKAMGVQPGVADLLFMWKRYSEGSEGSHTECGVLFLELKLPGRTASEPQIMFGRRARDAGADYVVARSVGQALEILDSHALLRRDRRVYGPGSTR